MSPVQTIAVVLLCLLTAACGREVKTAEPEPEPFFRVQEDLLGEEVFLSGLGVGFRPPIDWAGMEMASAERALGQALQGAAESTPLTLLHIYRRADEETSLAVSSLHFSRAVRHDSLLASIEKRIREEAVGHEVFVGNFENAGLPFTQFLVVKPERVTFKLFVPRGREEYVQFDYILPRSSYEMLLPYVESSIGSIRAE